LHVSKIVYNQIEDFHAFLRKQKEIIESEARRTLPEFHLQQFDEENVINPQGRSIQDAFLRPGEKKRFGDGCLGLCTSAKRQTRKSIWFVGYHYDKRPCAIEISIKEVLLENGKKGT
jgi:hypothetical protein